MEDVALLVLRLVVGLLFVGHGTQKLFGWFGGYGVAGTGQWLESVGIKPGKLMAAMAGASELGAGLLLILGLFIPIAALLIIATMLMSIVKVSGKNGLWVQNGGFEYNLVLIAVAAVLTLTGAGSFGL